MPIWLVKAPVHVGSFQVFWLGSQLAKRAAGSTGAADAFLPKEEASDTSAFHAQLLAALPAYMDMPQPCK